MDAWMDGCRFDSDNEMIHMHNIAFLVLKYQYPEVLFKLTLLVS